MKRELETINVGAHAVQVVIESDEHRIITTATCEGTVVTGVHTLHHKHDRTHEELEQDIQDFAKRLAHEAAGKNQNRILMERVFSVPKVEAK